MNSTEPISVKKFTQQTGQATVPLNAEDSQFIVISQILGARKIEILYTGCFKSIDAPHGLRTEAIPRVIFPCEPVHWVKS